MLWKDVVAECDMSWSVVLYVNALQDLLLLARWREGPWESDFRAAYDFPPPPPRRRPPPADQK